MARGNGGAAVRIALEWALEVIIEYEACKSCIRSARVNVSSSVYIKPDQLTTGVRGK